MNDEFNRSKPCPDCPDNAQIPDCRWVVVYHSTLGLVPVKGSHRFIHRHPPGKQKERCKP